MTKFSHLIIIIIFAPIYLFSETITIYATQSAQYSADDCCTLNILTNQNSNSLHSQDCQDMGAYYGCGMSKQVPFWVFDLSTVENNIDIQSIQFKGNLPSESWSDVYLSISTEVGQISTTIASDLWNGGDWASGSGQYSSINWPMGDFSQDLPLDIISQGIISGQLNILTYTSSPWSIFSIDNSGDNAPRIVIDYEDSQTNYSLSFDGANDYVDCGNDPSLNVTENFTIELWFKLEQWGSDDSDYYNYIVSKVSDSWDSGFTLMTNGEEQNEYYPQRSIIFSLFGPNNTFEYWHTNANTVSLNTWTHVAVTYSSGEVVLFINGQEQVINLYDGSDPITTNELPDHSSIPLYIGDRYDFNRPFVGLIDEVRFWDEIRSETEITENLFTNLSDSEDNLVGYWKFDEGSGAIAEDGSLNSNDGTIHGGTWVDYVMNPGCIYSSADNYDPTATHDDCSCTYDNQENLSLDLFTGFDDNLTDTTDGVVDFQSNISFPSSSGLTISFWAKRSPAAGVLFPPNVPDDIPIITFGSYAIDTKGTGAGTHELKFLGQTMHTNDYDGGIFDSENWVHITCVADLESAKMYIDQELVAETAENQISYSEFILNDEPSMIYGLGLIDQVGLWNRALSDEEVFALSYGTIDNGIIDINDPYLVGYWDFNQSESDCFDPIRLCCSSDTLYDRSNNGYDGIIKGGFWTFDGISLSLYPEITNIDDQEIEEDGSLSLMVNAVSPMNTSMTYHAESDMLDVVLSLDNSTLTATPSPNWNGTANISVMVTDENELSDTTDFMLTVTAVNDPPEAFSVTYPTVLDTFSTHMNSDTLIAFNWEESSDVDSDVTYTLTIELEFFGNTYTDVHENITDTTISISSNSLDPLLNVTSQDEATFTYYVHSSDDEYMVSSDIGEFILARAVLGINDGLSLPETFTLYQNYPNPFNPVTKLRYDLPQDSYVRVTVFDMLGNVVNNLINGNQNSGYKSVQWNATNNRGQPVSAGVYLYSIEAGDFRQTKKMIFLK